jgi:hypothetical protein
MKQPTAPKETNPLAGISVPSWLDIATKVVAHFGHGVIDLANPIQRDRLRRFLEQVMEMEVEFSLRTAIEAAISRSIDHTFKVMHDEDYQEKKRAAALVRKQKRAVKQKQAEELEHQARMESTKKQVEVTKTIIN